MTSLFEKKPPFVFSRPHENDTPAFFNKNSLGTVLENLRFWCPKMLFQCACGRKAKTEKKSICFQKHPGRTGQDLRASQ